MEDRLELKHLAPYLPYDLNILIYDSKLEHNTHLRINIYGFVKIKLNCNWLSILEKENGTGNEIKIFPVQISSREYDKKRIIKPILRPLSDLDKPIISGGLRLTPLYWWNEDDDATDKFNQMLNLQKQRAFHLHSTSYEVLERLLAWHFDVFGLIEKGLAIDINTI